MAYFTGLLGGVAQGGGLVVLGFGSSHGVSSLGVRLVTAMLEHLVGDLKERGELRWGDKVVPACVLQR